MSSAETVRAEEITLSVRDGRRVTTLVNATPIRSTDGAVESMVVTLQDLAPLEELERLRAEFLSMVSHALRTPLSAIKGSAPRGPWIRPRRGSSSGSSTSRPTRCWA